MNNRAGIGDREVMIMANTKQPQTIIGTALALMLAFAGTANAGKDTTTVKSMGQAAIYGDDVSNARDKAITDAQRKAVEQAIGSMVSSETVTENFELISDKILSRSSGYVRNYKILSEGKDDMGVYQVTIQAEVSSGNLNNDLQGILAVLQAKNMPRVLVMIAEQNISGSSATGGSVNLDIVENVFMDTWAPKGVQFVDRQALQGKIQTGPAITSLSNTQVKEFGSMTGAEVVIVGKAVANNMGPLPMKLQVPMYSIMADVSLRALNVDNGRIIATTTIQKATNHVNELTGGSIALKQGAVASANDLLKKILVGWEAEVAGPSTISLTLKGVKKSKFLRQVATFLRNQVRGVSNVRQRSFKKKVAELEVELKGSGQDLAEQLEEKPFPRFEVEIEEITQNKVVANLVPKK
jgi:hypothetical protein